MESARVFGQDWLFETIFAFYLFQRYQFNQFKTNETINKEEGKREGDEEENGENGYNFYIRPYIPFWSAQNLLFVEIAVLDKIKGQREGKYPRYVLEKLSRTWISNDPLDKLWFDQENVFEHIKKDLILKLKSKFVYDSSGNIFILIWESETIDVYIISIFFFFFSALIE